MKSLADGLKMEQLCWISNNWNYCVRVVFCGYVVNFKNKYLEKDRQVYRVLM